MTPLSENDLTVAKHLGQLKGMVGLLVVDVRDIKRALHDPKSGLWARVTRLESLLPAIERQPAIRLSAIAGGLAYVLHALVQGVQQLLHYLR